MLTPPFKAFAYVAILCLIQSLAMMAGRADEPTSDGRAMPAEDAVAFVQTYCVECHRGEEAEAGLDLESFDDESSVGDATDRWNKIADRVFAAEMPPADSELPSTETRKAFVLWVRGAVHAAVCGDGVTPAPPTVRRLNRNEYANTVRDLLGIHVSVGQALPDDGAGGEGFDNAAETLFISPIHAEKYLDAAHAALGHAMKDPTARNRILIASPSEDRSPQKAARTVLARFLPRAFRRPVSDAEIDEYTHLFEAALSEPSSFASAIQFAMEAALVSPKFLFIWENPVIGEEPQLITQHEMASRLSYFLWASMPDEELMRLANEGKLHDESVLKEQVARMLRSEIRGGLRRGAKVREFAANFTEQWLGTRALGREFKPDASIARGYNSELEGGMKYEPIFFFEDLLADNRSLLNLIDSDFTYVNRRLAKHYGVSGSFREQPKRVELPPDSRRGGVLGMGAVLAVSSMPHRTSPVLRGKWILETLLGTPPPPPPPDVQPLEEGESNNEPQSLRQRLEQHRADPTCASCHASIDPLGFGLENFDVLGRWRTEIKGISVDARGELPDGTTFEGPDELKELLLQRKEQFIRNFTGKMLGYSLARGLTDEDRCVVEEIAEKLEQDDYKAQTLIFEIVKSVPFRYKSAAPGAAIEQNELEATTESNSQRPPQPSDD